MPLVGYMKTTDPGRISTVTNLNGDSNRRKKILPIDAGHSESMYMRMYVMDCVSHDPPGGVVPVMLMSHQEGIGWKEIGTAQCCPLCWTIISPPVGADLPDPLPQEVPKKKITAKQKTALQNGRRRTKAEPVVQGFAEQQVILDLAESMGEFSVYDVMPALNLTRVPTLMHLSRLVRRKKLVVVSQSHGGPGNRTLYKKAP